MKQDPALDMVYGPGLVALLESIAKADTPDQNNKQGFVETPDKKSKAAAAAAAAKTTTLPKVDKPLECGKEDASSSKKKEQQSSKWLQEEVKYTEQKADNADDENVSSEGSDWMTFEGE